MAKSGSFNVAVAASYHSIPLVICAGLYTISPAYPFDPERLQLFSTPDAVLPFEKSMQYSFVELLANEPWRNRFGVGAINQSRARFHSSAFSGAVYHECWASTTGIYSQVIDGFVWISLVHLNL